MNTKNQDEKDKNNKITSSETISGLDTVSFTKLPDSEYEVMSVVWKNEPPVTTSILMNQLGNDKGWKLQTLITLLNRLTERGFLRSEKLGKERTYYPCINHEEYIRYETSIFVERYHDNSLFQLVNAPTKETESRHPTLGNGSTAVRELH
jgi:predicted transcriptional regulator